MNILLRFTFVTNFNQSMSKFLAQNYPKAKKAAQNCFWKHCYLQN